MSDNTDQGEVFSDFSLKNFASERGIFFFLVAYFVSSDVDRKVP